MERGQTRREAIGDVARTVSRLTDLAIVRARSHEALSEFAQFASVPVINALTELEHPCQVLSDLLTIQERFGRLSGLRLAFVGPPRHIANSLALAAGPTGMSLWIACPSDYGLPRPILEAARARGAVIEIVEDAHAAVHAADVIYTDAWPAEDQVRHLQARAVLARYRLDEALLASAPSHAIVMHEMPAHRGDEITEGVIDGPRSVVFDQAENRLHMAKAIARFFLGVSR